MGDTMNFRMIAVAFACALALGCGGDVEKKSGNNANNANNANNGNNQNNIRINNANNANNVPVCADNEALASVNGGAARCHTQCVAGSCSGELTCFEGICIDEAQTTNNVNNGDVCESNADCRVDQECKSGVCEDHLDCFGLQTDVCVWAWSPCSDDRFYEIRCGDGFCECLVNSTVVNEIGDTDLASTVCGQDRNTIHRAVNEACDWLVPYPEG